MPDRVNIKPEQPSNYFLRRWRTDISKTAKPKVKFIF